MKIKLKKIKFNKKSLIILTIIIFSTALFLFSRTAVLAADGSGTGWVTWLVGGLAQGIASILGWILMKLLAVLIQVAQYNDFIRSAAIVNGWVIARDIANMFFVIILLIIAFATILRIENYSYKKWLPKLILMAILINFSKTICGLLIDLSQVVMLTFVNAFKDVAAGSVVDMLGITGWQSLNGIKEVGGWTVASAYVLSVIYLIVTLITITAMIGMLVMRIIMIWVYVVLSPFAYLLAAFPGGANYSSQWWSEFIKNLIVGPVLAFFIWLSFTSLVSFNDKGNDVVKGFNDSTKDITCQTGADGECKYGTSDLMIKFIIAIAMLLGGMKVASEIGGAAGAVAGKGLAKVSALGSGAVNKLGRGAEKFGSWAGMQLGDVRDMASEKLKFDLNLVAGERRRREQVAANRERRKTRIRDVTTTEAEKGKTYFGRKAALFSTGDIAWQNLMDKKFFQGGSPGVVKDNIDKIEAEETKKKKLNEEIADIDKQSNKVLTMSENDQIIQQLKDLNKGMQNLNFQKNAILNDPTYKDLKDKEKKFTLTDKEEQELAKVEGIIKKYDEKIDQQKAIKDGLTSTVSGAIIVKNEQEKKKVIATNDSLINKKRKEVGDADKEIAKFSDILRKNQLSEVQSARADISAKIEAEASKKIANFSNPDQLVGIYKEAEEQQDRGLMAACYKKLAKTGNYNDLHRELGIGTGYDGMVKMAERLQTHGGMTEQDSRGLIAEIGELAKSVNHFEAFGAMSMNKAGQWELTGKDEQEAAILAEKSKIQVQQFVRSANRLGTGAYRNGEPHDAQHWDLSRSSIALFASKDKSYSEDLSKTGNINLIQFIGANEKNLKALEAAGATEVAKVIRDVCKKAKSNVGAPDVSNPLATIKRTIT
ncbi:MAG: hypothetical protein WCT50_04325 [Patescibacteria group bacterium]